MELPTPADVRGRPHSLQDAGIVRTRRGRRSPPKPPRPALTRPAPSHPAPERLAPRKPAQQPHWPPTTEHVCEGRPSRPHGQIFVIIQNAIWPHSAFNRFTPPCRRTRPLPYATYPPAIVGGEGAGGRCRLEPMRVRAPQEKKSAPRRGSPDVPRACTRAITQPLGVGPATIGAHLVWVAPFRVRA
jgi:hypothetical protein